VLGPSRWTDIYKPIIAAVNGTAYAGGLEWVCFADIRIAEVHASFGVTCRRWNIGLADGGTQRLPRIVGMGRAMEMIITGRVVGAEEALRTRGFGMPLAEGLRIEAQCFNPSLYDPAAIEGKRQFNERDHPDRRREQAARTPSLVRDRV
jgi:enoyl-CoA hydratase